MSAESPGAREISALPSAAWQLAGVPLIAALLAVAMLCGVGWVAAVEATSAVQSAAQERVRSNRDAAARALVRQTDDLKFSVASWAASAPVIDSLDAPTTASLRAIQDQLATLARSENSPGVFVADLRGRIVASFPEQPELIGGDYSYRDWFKGAARTGEPYVSEAYRTAVTGHPLVVGVSAPVSEGARRVGYITILWQLDAVRDLSDGSRADDGLTITVTDQVGQPLTGALSLDDRGEALLPPISPEGKITDVNEAAVRVTGIPREELVGTDFSGHFTEPEKADESYRRVFAEGSVTDFPLTMRHLDGTLTEVLYNASVYRDVGGKVLGVLAAPAM